MVARSFSIELQNFVDADVVADNDSLQAVEFAMIDGIELSIEGATAAVQGVKFAAAKAFTVVVLGVKATPANIEFIKKSGATAVIFESEFFNSSKPEYFCSQAVKSKYYPVKASDLSEGATLECTLFHLMPMAKKFVPAVPAKTEIQVSKLQKLQELGEVYIHKSDIDAFARYASGLDVKSAAGLTRRCRGLFLNLNATFADLVLHLSDQSTNASFTDGKKLFERIDILASDLLTTLSSVGEAWQIINNAGFGGFGPIDRGPSIASYAGLLSFISGVGDPKAAMIASLLSDIGLLEVSPKASQKLRENLIGEFSAEEKAQYEQHPVYSVNQCLSKKVALPEKVKAAILHSHERMDQKGFPNQVLPEKISDETWILQICELVDLKTQVRIGEQRKDIHQVRTEVFEHEFNSGKKISIEFLSKIKSSFLD